MKNYLPPNTQPWVRWVESQLAKANSKKAVDTKTIVRKESVAPLEELVIRSPGLPEEGVIFENPTWQTPSPTEFRYPFTWDQGALTGYTATFSATLTVPEADTVIDVYMDTRTDPSYTATSLEANETIEIESSVDYPAVETTMGETPPEDADPGTEVADTFVETSLGREVVIKTSKPGVTVESARLEVVGPSGSYLRFFIDADGTVHAEAQDRNSDTRDLGDVSVEDMSAILDQVSGGMTDEERARLEQVAAGLEAAQTEFEAAQVELGSRLTAAEQADAQAREDIQALDTRLETAKVDLSGIRAELADAVAVAEDAGAKAAALEAEADRLASELGVTDAKAVAAREAADAAQAEADRLAGLLADAVSAAQAAQATADQATLDARDAHNAAVTAQEAADALQAEADALQAEADRLAGELGATDAKAVAAQTAATNARTAASNAQTAANAAKSRADAAYTLASGKADKSALDAVVASVNGKNSVTISTSAPGSTTPGVAVGDVWWRRDAANNVYGQWTWDGSKWVASQVRNEMLAGLDVHKLQVTGDARIAEAVIEKLWVDGLVAKVLTTSRLVVSPGNHYRDPNLLEQAGWGTYWNTSGGYTGGGSILLPAGTSNRFQYDLPDSGAMQGTRVEGGREYALSIWVNADRAGNDNALRLYVRWFAADGTRISVPSVLLPGQAGGVWTRQEAVFKAPATAAFMTLGLYASSAYTGTVRFSDISLVPKVGAVLIEDGAITAPKIAGEAVTADKLAANSVTARTLAVVPESGQGGLALDARGLDIIPPDVKAGTSISMRVDTPAAITFAQGDAATFSVSPKGDLSATSVSANDSLEYRGTEMQDILDQFPRGVMAQVKMQSGAVTTDASMARLMAVTFTPPTTPRMVRVSLDYNLSGTAGTTGYIEMKQSAGTAVTWRNSSIANAYLDAVVKSTRDYSQSWIMPTTSDGWGWPSDGTDITVGAFIRALTSTGTVTVNGSYGVRLTIEDLGPAVEVETVESYSPYESKGTDAGISKKKYVGTWEASAFDQYGSGSSSVYHLSQKPVQGTIAGYNWTTHMLFPHSAIRTALSGASIDKVEVYLANAHWGTSSGGRVRVGTHNYSSLPSTYGTATVVKEQSMSRGQASWITLPNSVGVGFQNATVKGLSLDALGYAALTYYGYFLWDGSGRPKIRITYTK